ncbi:metal-dependent hydrolase [Botrimarina mediterranea]|uniref:Inner membrane protein n=1 Tax=Botrimarina mediterranea TaxID=2528022 RepID=A0A518KAB5_9BACT|nr:metal-dependent hydrolase [Botrimarina mediterranea]QDV74728.1 hypothetical protein Spa11_29360 [Botrimarina mediterranea]QDV79360.1 hypothetical protein K2D_29740 [Planctomycetes bacterium K2D]
MADFKTHVTFSSAIGAGYAVVASGLGFDLSTSVLAGGLCGVSGMLPDIDSDSGVPRREALGFAAAVIPLLMIDRFKQFDLSHDQIVLCGVLMYFGIRFWLAKLIGRWSVHRGMWHSIPAVLTFAGLAFLISGPPDQIFVRYLKAIAVGLGALSHLVLDEVYSIDTRGVVPKFKKSFGTAVKFFGKDPKANFSAYAKLAVVALMIGTEPMVIDRVELRNPQLAAKLRGTASKVEAIEERLAQRTGGGLNNSTPPSPSVSNWSNVFRRSDPDRQSAPAQDRQSSPQPPTYPLPSQQPAQPTTLPPGTPSWFAPPGATSGGFAPNRSAALSEPFTR